MIEAIIILAITDIILICILRKAWLNFPYLVIDPRMAFETKSILRTNPIVWECLASRVVIEHRFSGKGLYCFIKLYDPERKIKNLLRTQTKEND